MAEIRSLNPPYIIQIINKFITMKKYSITVKYKVEGVKYNFTTVQESNNEQGALIKLLNILIITGEINKIIINEITY